MPSTVTLIRLTPPNVARARPEATARLSRWRSYLRPMLLGSVLVHLALLVLILLFARTPPPREAYAPPGIAVLFESGSRTGPAVPKPDRGHDASTSAAPPLAPSPTPPLATAVPPPPPAISPRIPEIAAPPLPTPVVPSPTTTTAVPLPPAPLLPPVAPPSAVLPRMPPPEPRRVPQEKPRVVARVVPPVARPRVPRQTSPFAAPMDFSFGNTPSAAHSPSSQASGELVGPSARDRFSTAASRFGSSIQVVGHPAPGGDWINELMAWVKAHGYYPHEAAMNGEQGPVVMRLVIDSSGRVNSVDLISRSGSQWLDLAGQGLFRGARVPAFPPDTPYHDVTLDFTINYIIIRR